MDAITKGCTIEQEALEEEYDDEILCAGWNPQLDLASASPVARNDRHVNLPADLVNVNIDEFLKKMYEYQ